VATDPHAAQSRLAGLALLPSTALHLRDGEVVVFRNRHSPIWQCRYKLRDGTWIRASTRHATLECAIPAACELYDEARFRQRLGLAHRGSTFSEIAQETVRELRTELDAGRGKVVYRTYITCIERYFLPYFQDRVLEHLSNADVTQFEVWRNRQMQKVPRASTLNNFAAAWSRLLQVAIDRGWVSARAQIPKLSTRGIKSTPRPAFSKEEVEALLAFMPQWAEQGRLAVEREIRPLLRDYVEILLLTGIRHGTEAMGLCWNHLEWHEHERKKYLRLWVANSYRKDLAQQSRGCRRRKEFRCSVSQILSSCTRTNQSQRS
jgi:integrase